MLITTVTIAALFVVATISAILVAPRYTLTVLLFAEFVFVNANSISTLPLLPIVPPGSVYGYNSVSVKEPARICWVLDSERMPLGTIKVGNAPPLNGILLLLLFGIRLFIRTAHFQFLI